MKKVLMVASVASMIGQFNMNNLSILQELEYEVHVACNFMDRTIWTNERIKYFVDELRVKGISYHQIEFPREPIDIKRISMAYRELKKLVYTNKFDFIHCHAPVAGVISRIVAHQSHTNIVYTSHGFHFFNGASKKNWILFYPIEKFLSKWTDILITINMEDYNRAKDKFRAKRIVYIPGVGVDTYKFYPKEYNEENELEYIEKFQKIRSEFNIPLDAKVLVSVGELNENKNHESVIRALADISDLHSKDVFYLIAGKGKLKEKLQRVIDELGLTRRVILMGFRNDITDIYISANAYILPSHREGLNVSLMEAMASGLPCLCGNIRGNVDLIDTNGGFLFNSSSVSDIREKISMFLKLNDSQMAIMRSHNLKKVKFFDKNVVDNSMKMIYEMFLE